MKQRWNRLLWLKQDYPDNYTDPDFLDEVLELRKVQSSPRSTSSYCKVVRDFLLFYHRVMNTGLMYVTFALLNHYRLDPIYFTGALTCLAFIVAVLFHHAAVPVKSPLIIIFTMLVLSPVLKSLSRTMSSDSIWTISCWLTACYILSIFLHTESIVSTNILVSNVAVLASRLQSTTDVFCFLLICMELNVLLPYLEKSLRARHFHTCYAIAFMANNAVVYYFITSCRGWMYTIIFASSSLSFVFGLPRYFIYWQQNYYKGGELLSKWDAKTPILD
ncbi:LANO_0E08834g1_1 [Lachancea nothofagi CBS 11611]|uniref:LANO_0E08834g1_1 n=1 Tax=Lachancea nothofagi CBS 11611 TaxID=1266666 RepID=A0A1G4JVB0_9SACH|nr:LANO_0E08834g1_1 [Lachancea nothofagi CBS 11611]